VTYLAADLVRVLFIWDVRAELRDFLQAGLADLKNVNLVFPDEIDEDTLLKLAPEADVLIGWRPSRDLLNSAKKMSLFVNPGAGVQHHIEVFRDINRERRVVLANGHGNSYFTAQHAVALLLSLSNKVLHHHRWMARGKWRTGDSDASSIPLRRRAVGLLGYGAVNRHVHKFLSGFDVEFHILKRSWPNSSTTTPTEYERYKPSQIHEFLRRVDTLIVAIPQTPETIGLIGREELELLGKNGLLVNMARGVVIDEQSLFNALKDETIAGAAIDVWYEYRPEADADGRKFPYSKPFHELENVVLSPHRGASPFRDLERWNEVIENITRFAAGRTDFLNIVDLDRGY
jgi:phosphoglycerate dehydrogenase-like enzyme